MLTRLGAALRSAKEVNGEVSNTVKDPKPSLVSHDNCSTRFLAMPRNSPPLEIRRRV